MTDILEFLLHDPLFKSEVKYISKSYKKDEKIIEQGKTHKRFCLIKQGKVKIVINRSFEHAELPVHPNIIQLGPNETFGEFALLDDFVASADVIAVTDVDLVEIDIISLRRFLEAHPEIGYRILLRLQKDLVAHLRHANKAIVNLYSWGLKAHKIDKYII